MDLYMSVLIYECREVSENGIEIIDYKSGKKYIKRLVPFSSCVDTVARPIIQNRIQFNG